MKTILFILSFLSFTAQADDYKNKYIEPTTDAINLLAPFLGKAGVIIPPITIGTKYLNKYIEDKINSYPFDQNYIDKRGGFIYNEQGRVIQPTKDSVGYHINEQKIKNRYPNLRKE